MTAHTVSLMGDREKTRPESNAPSYTTASTEHEDVSHITPGSRKTSRKTKVLDDNDEPLVDTTAALPLRSKKTQRAKKQLERKQMKAAQRPTATTLLDLPPELLQEILSYLRPSDIFLLQRVNHTVHSFVQENSNTIARDIIRRRYWVLSRCFPLPVPFSDVDPSAHAALLSDKRQEMLQIHKKPYHHVKGIDPRRICTCMSCVFAWNNLNLILDLSHWQKNLNEREPIPMIPRGTAPAWNAQLLDLHARTVEKAMSSRLVYSCILEKHLRTTVQTITRTIRGKKTMHPKRLYHLTTREAGILEAGEETDEFLERNGPPSYEFPWHRDNYYGLEAYVPNRRWSKEEERWVYHAEGLHERDLAWVRERFTPAPEGHGGEVDLKEKEQEKIMEAEACVLNDKEKLDEFIEGFRGRQAEV